MEKDERFKWKEDELDLETRIFKNNKGDVFIPEVLSLISLWDSQNKRLAGNRVKQDLDKAVSFPALATDCLIEVTDGERWRIHEIILMMIADANPANRVLDITMGQTLNTISATTIDITGITLTAGQLGSITLTAGFAPNLWTNDNGTLAVVANENPLPIILLGGTVVGSDNINGVATNKEAGDILEMIVYYERL